MKLWLKIPLGFVAVFGVAVVGGAAFVHSSFNKKLNIHYDTAVASFPLPTDPARIENGARLAKVKGCGDCHGEGLGGKVFIDDPGMGRLVAPNLTRGKKGIGATYAQDEDWIRTMRYGVTPQGLSVKFMPSHEYSPMSNEDLGDLIAYVKSIPPIDRDLPETNLGFLVKLLYTTGQMPSFFPAELIDRSKPSPEKVVAEATATYGAYMAAACVSCHNPQFTGGKIPGVPPAWPASTDLTSKGRVGKWTLDEFKSTLRTGVTPEGLKLNPVYMPWPAAAAMNDIELEALYIFFKSLPKT